MVSKEAKMATSKKKKSVSPEALDEAEVAAPRDGYIIDYISGKSIKDGPEEREAVQVFARMLVDDYGYPKIHLQTRPQHRVKVRPSTNNLKYVG